MHDARLVHTPTGRFRENEYRYSVNSGAQPVEMDLTPANPDQPAERWIVEVVTPTKVRVAMAAKGAGGQSCPLGWSWS